MTVTVVYKDNVPVSSVAGSPGLSVKWCTCVCVCVCAV